MRKLFLGAGLILAIVTITFLGCSKEELIKPQNETISNLDEKVGFNYASQMQPEQLIKEYLNGNLLDDKFQFSDNEEIITVYHYKYPDKMFHFDNQADFEKWVSKQKFDEDLIEINKQVEFIAAYALENGVEKYYENNGTYPKEFETMLLDFSNLKTLNDKIGLTKLYDNTYFGSSLGLYGIVGNLRKNRNKAESFKQMGTTVGVYCDNRYWGGSKLYFISFPYGTFPHLGSWRNRIESILFTN